MEESRQRYALGEKLHQGRRGSVYRAVRRADGHKVVLRVLDGNDPVAGKIERLKHELDSRSTLHGLPAVEPLALSTLNGAPALELEDFVGQSLDRLVDGAAPGRGLSPARDLGGGRGRRHPQPRAHSQGSQPGQHPLRSADPPGQGRQLRRRLARGAGADQPRARSACWRSPSRMSRPSRPGA